MTATTIPTTPTIPSTPTSNCTAITVIANANLPVETKAQFKKEMDALSGIGKADASYMASVRNLTKTESLSPTAAIALSWCAGFVDGEGCISAVWQRFHKTGRRPTVRIRLDVGQNDLEVLQHLQTALGEKERIYKGARGAGQNSQPYVFTLDGARAVAAVAKLSPFLVRKKPEADFLLAAIERCWLGNRPGPRGYPEHVWKAREQLVKKLQRLK